MNNLLRLKILIGIFFCINYSNAQHSIANRKSNNPYRANYQRIFSSVESLSTFKIRADGTLWAWGSNANGILGDGTTIDKSNPTQIATSSKWISIAAAYQNSFALKADGTLWGWGTNNSGILGNGNSIAQNLPVQIGSENTWTNVIRGYAHTLATKTSGTLWGWGRRATWFRFCIQYTNYFTCFYKYKTIRSVSGGCWQKFYNIFKFRWYIMELGS